MAWSFGDSFDLYAAAADAINGYWDATSVVGSAVFSAGRFSGSRAFNGGSTTRGMDKTSGQNDAVHHFVFAFQQTAAISGSTLGFYINLYDGAAVQCSLAINTGGNMLLTSASVGGGTTLATYTSAVTAASTWFAFEVEIVVNNTTGSIKVRRNGNTVEDFTATAINTRNGSTNNYANKIQIGVVSAGSHHVDDLFWKSDASSVPWMGDIRCYTRMPASDQSVTFSRTPTSAFMQNNAGTGSSGLLSANFIRAVSVTATMTGTLAGFSFNFNAGITGHAKMALYDSTGVGGGAGALLASSAELTNPGAGVNVFSVAGGPTVTRGTVYWIALWSDVNITGVGPLGGVGPDQLALTYTTSFPSTMAGFTTPGVTNGLGSNAMTVTPLLNASCVNEAQQDATTTYVYDSNPGDADFYGIASISGTPATVIATTARAYAMKSDAGTRTAAVQLKSGGTTVASPTLTLTTSGWQWAWRTDTVDPATGAAWTPAAVNTVQIGPKTVA